MTLKCVHRVNSLCISNQFFRMHHLQQVKYIIKGHASPFLVCRKRSWWWGEGERPISSSTICTSIAAAQNKPVTSSPHFGLLMTREKKRRGTNAG